MTDFADQTAPIAVSAEIAKCHRAALAQLAQPGTWWSAADRRAIAGRARERFAHRATPSWLRTDAVAQDGAEPNTEPSGKPTEATLDPTVAATVDRITLDPAAIDRSWAQETAEALGDGEYVELVAIVAVVVMIDIHAEATGGERPTFLPAEPGEPERQRPSGLGDIGAYVPVLDPFPAANVARALSLVPAANTLFRTVSVPSYSAPGFGDLEWATALSRPQVELVAARVAALNECFY